MSTATLLFLARQMRDHRARPSAGHQARRARPACGGAARPRHAMAGLVALTLGLTLTLILTGGAVFAQAGQMPDRGEARQIGGKAVPCVMVDIAGHRAGQLDCASQKLEAAARTAQARTRSAIDTPVISATSQDVRTGVANQAATRQRMGSSFGVSVHPQRPNRAPTPPPTMPRPGGRP